MNKYFAFLRAINAGGHHVKMDTLCQLLTQAGLMNVESYIASGNFIFTSSERNTTVLEKQVEAVLETELGYSVSTFIRTEGQLSEIKKFQSFAPEIIKTSTAFNIAFLPDILDNSRIKLIKRWESEIDSFNYHQREIYWICTKKQSESTFSNAVLEKTLGLRSTIRGFNTIKNIVDKYISV